MAFANHNGNKPALVRARLARALATAIEAGLPLDRAVRLAADASANPQLKAFVHSIPQRTVSTQSLSKTLARCPHLTPEFLGVLEVAEATGDFRVVARLADLYEDGFR
jgi:type II secretory pathway component PulF